MTYFDRPPTVADIARGLSTIPRWTSRTVLNRAGLPGWTVLQHTLAGAPLAQKQGPLVYAYWLLHDAEEMLVGDTPAPYKTDQQAALGDDVRNEILRGLGLPVPNGAIWESVGHVDILVREAERWVLLHPAEFIGRTTPDLFVTDQVWGLLDLDVRAGIELFTDLTTAALAEPRVRSLASRV